MGALQSCFTKIYGRMVGQKLEDEHNQALVTFDKQRKGPKVFAGNFTASGDGTILCVAALHQVKPEACDDLLVPFVVCIISILCVYGCLVY